MVMVSVLKLKLLVKDEIISCDLGNLGNLQSVVWWSFMNGRIQTWQWTFLFYIGELKKCTNFKCPFFPLGMDPLLVL